MTKYREIAGEHCENSDDDIQPSRIGFMTFLADRLERSIFDQKIAHLFLQTGMRRPFDDPPEPIDFLPNLSDGLLKFGKT